MKSAPDANTTSDANAMSDANTAPDAASLFTVTVTLGGNGAGTVTSSPTGIACPGDCEEDYAASTTVTLTATPTGGSSFEGWSGNGCSGTGTCVVTVSAAIDVTATFSRPQFDLTLTKSGTGIGTVTSEPVGISCGPTCTAAFDPNTMVTLTAAADNNASFTGWTGGGCSGTGPCVVTMTAAISVNAAFSCASGSLTFNYTGAAQIFTVPNCITSITIDASGAEGGAGGGAGGLGGRAQGTTTVTGGEDLVILVGGAGIAVPTQGDTNGFRGGFNGGGDVFEYVGWVDQLEGLSGTGGGASDVRRGGSALANRIIVAAGGGGGGVGVGGGGGGLIGGTAPSGGDNMKGGGGGTQAMGGAAFQCCGASYPNENGSLGLGGDAYRDGSGSGGGGGGYYGGGGGSFDGGGGGSSFILGLTSASTTPSVNSGSGVVTIFW